MQPVNPYSPPSPYYPAGPAGGWISNCLMNRTSKKQIFRQQYGHKATFNDNATPMPPTLLFHLELKALEAQHVLTQSESVAA